MWVSVLTGEWYQLTALCKEPHSLCFVKYSQRWSWKGCKLTWISIPSGWLTQLLSTTTTSLSLHLCSTRVFTHYVVEIILLKYPKHKLNFKVCNGQWKWSPTIDLCYKNIFGFNYSDVILKVILKVICAEVVRSSLWGGRTSDIETTTYQCLAHQSTITVGNWTDV